MTILTLYDLEAQGFKNIPYLSFEIRGVRYQTFSHGRMRAEVIEGKINRIYEMPR